MSSDDDSDGAELSALTERLLEYEHRITALENAPDYVPSSGDYAILGSRIGRAGRWAIGILFPLAIGAPIMISSRTHQDLTQMREELREGLRPVRLEIVDIKEDVHGLVLFAEEGKRATADDLNQAMARSGASILRMQQQMAQTSRCVAKNFRLHAYELGPKDPSVLQDLKACERRMDDLAEELEVSYAGWLGATSSDER